MSTLSVSFLYCGRPEWCLAGLLRLFLGLSVGVVLRPLSPLPPLFSPTHLPGWETCSAVASHPSEQGTKREKQHWSTYCVYSLGLDLLRLESWQHQHCSLLAVNSRALPLGAGQSWEAPSVCS